MVKRMKKVMAVALVFLMVLTTGLMAAAATSKGTMEQKSMKTSQTTVKYWLYTPENATEDMPLIVYLHGGSGKGSNLTTLTSLDGFPKYLNDGDISPNAYVIIPQMPSSYSTWARLAVSVKEIIDSVCTAYDIDTTKISLTGHSMGGGGTYELALKYPDTFARIAPLSGRVTNTSANVNTLLNMPIRAFVGSADTTVAPSYTQNFIASILAANPSADVSVVTLNGALHAEVPGLVYLNEETYGLIDWLDFGFGTAEPEEETTEATTEEEPSTEETTTEDEEVTTEEPDTEEVSVDVNVTITKKVTTKRTRWIAEITAQGNGVEVSKIEYSVKGKKWVESTTYTATYEIETFYIRVTDENGTIYNYVYSDGQIAAQ